MNKTLTGFIVLAGLLVLSFGSLSAQEDKFTVTVDKVLP